MNPTILMTIRFSISIILLLQVAFFIFVLAALRGFPTETAKSNGILIKSFIIFFLFELVVKKNFCEILLYLCIVEGFIKIEGVIIKNDICLVVLIQVL